MVAAWRQHGENCGLSCFDRTSFPSLRNRGVSAVSPEEFFGSICARTFKRQSIVCQTLSDLQSSEPSKLDTPALGLLSLFSFSSDHQARYFRILASLRLSRDFFEPQVKVCNRPKTQRQINQGLNNSIDPTHYRYRLRTINNQRFPEAYIITEPQHPSILRTHTWLAS